MIEFPNAHKSYNSFPLLAVVWQHIFFVQMSLRDVKYSISLYSKYKDELKIGKVSK